MPLALLLLCGGLAMHFPRLYRQTATRAGRLWPDAPDRRAAEEHGRLVFTGSLPLTFMAGFGILLGTGCHLSAADGDR